MHRKKNTKPEKCNMSKCNAKIAIIKMNLRKFMGFFKKTNTDKRLVTFVTVLLQKGR